MKTMKQVFDGKPCGFSPRMTDEQVRYAQHAINCHDDLKAALQAFADFKAGENEGLADSDSLWQMADSALMKAESIQ